MIEDQYDALSAEDKDRVNAANARYLAAMHGVQTGVGYEHAQGSQDQTPKHLRVGIASSHVTDAAVASLLIERGVFTLPEYTERLAVMAEREVADYERRLTETMGNGTTKISLL